VSLRAAGFTGRVVVDRTSNACVEDATPPQGKIDCHSPDPGEVVYTDKEVQVHVYEARQRAGVLMAAQLAPIKGMKIEEAKAYLKKIGHTGKVEVSTGMVVSDKCVPGTVCSFNAQGASEPIDVDIDLYTKE
jgi:beta-lactam-binding protein with PASTA domain